MFVSKKYIIFYISISIIAVIASAFVSGVVNSIDSIGTKEVQRREIDKLNKEIEDAKAEEERLLRIIEGYKAEDIDLLKNRVKNLLELVDNKDAQIEDLRKEVKELKKEVENLNNKLDEAQTSNLVQLAKYRLTVVEDDISIDNIIQAALLLDDTEIERGKDFDFNTFIKSNADRFVVDEHGDKPGLSHVANGLYNVSKKSGLRIVKASTDKNGKVYIDNRKTLTIRNNTQGTIKIQSRYNEGTLTFKILG